METYKEQIKNEVLEQMTKNIIKLETENLRQKKIIDNLLTEIAMANKFIKAQEEYYEKKINEIKN